LLLGHGEIAQLAESQRDGQVVVVLSAGEIASRKRGLGGVELALQRFAGIIGRGPDCSVLKAACNQKRC